MEPAGTTEPTPSSWAQDPPRPLLVDAAVRVVVDELNARARPSTSARLVGAVVRGNILVFRGAPIEADGYIWYRGWLAGERLGDVPPPPRPILDVGDPLGGWFATSRGAIAYVTPIEPRCPDVIDFANVVAMLGAERLTCFDDRSIEVQGTYGCFGCTTHIFGAYKPDWLTNPNSVEQFLWDVPMEDMGLLLRFPPDGFPKPQGGDILRVQGHFRDEAAERCSIALAYPWADGFEFHPVGPSVARQLCRQEFVVDRYDVLGTDPRFEQIE